MVKLKGKVGIITLNNYNNYGNRLQNYALEEFLRINGYEPQTIINKTINKKYLTIHRKQKVKELYNSGIKGVFKFTKNKIFDKIHKETSNLTSLREDRFKEFSRKYINESSFYIDMNNNCIKEDEYDFFIVGSDQVWNPFYMEVSSISFLSFVPKRKRISYAASFGVSKIPDTHLDDYKKWLLGINKISVREDAGANIVKELTGRDVPVLIDPTMLLNKEQWLSISKKSVYKPKNKYILTYLLGGGTDEEKKIIQEISKKYNLEVVNLCDIKEEKYYITCPSEFIDYINDASIFLTDSFHGCVFSLILDTPFIVCNRVGQNYKTSMESRIDTFLNKFKLESRRFSNINNINIFKCDYTISYDILENERLKAQQYLKEVFGS